MESLDQIFVNLKGWAVGLFPELLQPWVSIGLSIAAILAVFPLMFALTTVVERKAIGRMQNRYGPNRVGPYGFLQFAADGIKSLIKEDIVPRAADKLVHFLAPVMLLVPVLLTFAVLPVGRNMAPIDLDAGLLFFFAVGAASELAIFMAGWSSRNKYSLLGAMRAIAQMISYEVPLVLSAVVAVMAVGSLSPVAIAAAQADYYSFGLAKWHVFTPWGVVGFVLFFIAALAEANRSPFDLPEGESELVAGYFTEYSGFKFALFFMAEYLGLFAASGMAITLFLGGWSAPLSFLQFIPSWAWFFGKLFALIAFVIWLRGTMPRIRMDQLMNFAWKFMLPMALLNVLVMGVWQFVESAPLKWVVSITVLGYAWQRLGTLVAGKGRFAPRTYRFAAE